VSEGGGLIKVGYLSYSLSRDADITHHCSPTGPLPPRPQSPSKLSVALLFTIQIPVNYIRRWRYRGAGRGWEGLERGGGMLFWGLGGEGVAFGSRGAGGRLLGGGSKGERGEEDVLV